jgi:hypothetical protein
MMTLLTGAVLAAALGTTAVAYATRLASSSVFMSSLQTATGSAQTIAHGLAGTPRLVWPSPVVFGVGAPSFAVSADATNITATIGPAGTTYYVLAIL